MNFYDLGYSKFLTKSIISDPEITKSGSGGGYSGSISSSDLSVQLNPVTDIVFSSTDANTAAWTAGTIYFSNGSNSGNIVAGNTGNITAKTYVYFDGDKPAQLLMDTDIKNVFGGRKMLLAIVEEGAAGKSCKITPIITTGYTGNIVAENINVTQLDAVAANTGTLTVDESITAGGTANGIIYVKDSAGTTKVQLDNTGITVNSGKLTIKNDSDATTIDSKGIVSTQNFASGNTNAEPNTAFTDTTFVEVANSSMSFTLTRTTKVLFLLSLQSGSGQTGAGDMSGRNFYTVHLDGIAQQPEILIDASLTAATTGAQENTIRKSYSTTMIKSVATGTHTVDFRYKMVSASNMTSTLYKWDLSYIVLGT